MSRYNRDAGDPTDPPTGSKDPVAIDLMDASGSTVICPVDGTPPTPIAELLVLAALLSPAVVDVEIVKPTLEDVFLQLTGRPEADVHQQATA